MPKPVPTKRSQRLKYVGMLEKNDGIVIYARLEFLHGPAGWIATGAVLSLAMSDDQVIGEAWHNALAGATDRAYRRRVVSLITDDEPLPEL